MCPADSYGESQQLPLLRESTGLSLAGITVARQCRICTDFAHCGVPQTESDSRQSHTNTMHMGVRRGGWKMLQVVPGSESSGAQVPDDCPRSFGVDQGVQLLKIGFGTGHDDACGRAAGAG